VHPTRCIYEGTYVNPQGDSQRSRVFEYEGGARRAGGHERREGALVLLDRNPARALLLNRGTGNFARYATFADLPNCPPLGGQNCSPSTTDGPPVPNYAARGPDAAAT
jgi:hypothetical protein